MKPAAAFDLDVDIVELASCPPAAPAGPLREVAFRRDAWLPAEVERLRAMFAADETMDTIASALGRGRAGVADKALTLGLRRHSSRPWGELEDRMLVDRYGTVPAADLALELGRSCTSVYARAQLLELSEESSPPYNEWEDAQLRAGYARGLRADQVATLIGRTKVSVASRAWKLGLRTVFADEDWSQEEIDWLFELATEGHRYLAIIEMLVAKGFPRRTKAGLGPKLRQLGYRRGWGRRWLPEEDEAIRRAYADGASLTPLLERLGRTTCSIRWRVKELGLQGTHVMTAGFRQGPVWTSADEDLLRALYGKVPTRELAERLGRKKGGVLQRAFHLGLKHGYWRPYTADELRGFAVAFDHGLAIADLAIALERHPMTVSKYARDKLGLHFGRRRRSKPPLTLPQILALDPPPATRSLPISPRRDRLQQVLERRKSPRMLRVAKRARA